MAGCTACSRGAFSRGCRAFPVAAVRLAPCICQAGLPCFAGFSGEGAANVGLLPIYRPQQDQCTAPVQALDDAVRSFEPHLQTLASTLLRRLLTPGQMFPDLAQPLAELEQATDWREAASTGRVVPAKVGRGMGAAGPAGSQGVPLSLHAEKGMGCQLWPPPGTGAVQQSHATPD